MSDDFLRDGESAGSFPPIEYRTWIKAAPDRVWAALATAEGLNAWFTSGTELEPEPGGTLRLRWTAFGADRTTAEDGGPISAYEPPRRFGFTWQPGLTRTAVTFELEPHGGGTFVSVTETGHTDHPDDIVALVTCAAGWGEALTLLKMYCEHGVTYGEVPA